MLPIAAISLAREVQSRPPSRVRSPGRFAEAVARRIVTVHVAAETITITIDLGEDTRTVRRTTTTSQSAASSPAVPQGRPCFLGNLESMSWDRFVKTHVGLDS
jgi:hypothetical protein